MERFGPPLAAFTSILRSAEALIVALGVIVGTVSAVTAAAFAPGSSALDQALSAEETALETVRDAQEESAPHILEDICPTASHLCNPDFVKNSTEGAIVSAFDLGTRLTIDSLARDVAGPADLPELSPPKLENRLAMAIGADIRDTLQVEATVVQDAFANCIEYFGDDHEYAHRVRSLIIAEVRRKALEASPGLVEKPEWWRDWLLAGGMTIGGAMIGAVLGGWLWRRIDRSRRSSGQQADRT